MSHGTELSARRTPDRFFLFSVLWFALFSLAIFYGEELSIYAFTFITVFIPFLYLPGIYLSWLLLGGVWSKTRARPPRKNWSRRVIWTVMACLLAGSGLGLIPGRGLMRWLSDCSYLVRHQSEFDKQIDLIREAKADSWDAVVDGRFIRVAESPLRVVFLRHALMGVNGYLWDPSGENPDDPFRHSRTSVRHVYGDWYYYRSQ